MMLPMLVLAAACASWHPDVTGRYDGIVESQGEKAIDTWIEETPAGLAGRYVLHEPDREVTGTLEPLGDADCQTALFRWTDVYGSGIARLRFDPFAHCFEGHWGLEQPIAQLPWRSCTRSRVTS